MTKILVTGAAGQIGSELTQVLRREHGDENVVATDIKPPRFPGAEAGPWVPLDVTDRAQVERVIQEFGIAEVYHLAAVLSASGERDPDRAWRVNTEGLYNVLEAARRHGVRRIFWPSSIAVFGPKTPRVNTPQDTILAPTTMYGITKVVGELLCEYYHRRYGLDVRGLRFPGIISSATPPGGGTTDYAVEIFYAAVRGEPYTCFVRPDTVLPMMYMPDCLKAIRLLMAADPARLRYRIYNVTGLSFAAEELARELQRRVPGFRVEYRPDFRQDIADSWPRTIDDSAAREDWGWKPDYDLPRMVEAMLAALRERRARGEL
ncbi:MAG: NAD-dependent epimerase/dehydratase family protein [Candidatus Bipolaricaulota bacterium]|nr:NAD-dependent epimerase/dehydratase family protein [Candidatus Bipolaricaulota bacterium]MCX7844460.1 NAD-dependent epimerase/dehydratase family protein [Candidatus Bipolaricaulota bacterium]MDW8152160.1 NAD-dependent epimerase/dehydratase family protein [Candidatus Bipolaricaulota bacterium]